MTDKQERVDALIEQLRKVEGGPFPTGSIGTCWYRNPEGPEAAAIITEQAETIARLREALEQVGEIVARRQLPITNHIADIVDAALEPTKA